MPKGCPRAILLASLLALQAFADRYRGHVTAIEDGDTLTVVDTAGTTHHVRLYGVDAPEGGQPFAAAARECLSSRCLEAEVDLQVRWAEKSGRVVATAIHADGSDLALSLVEQGCAWCNPRHGPVSEVYRGAEIIARRERRGLWQDDAPVPPWNWHGPRQTEEPTGPASLTGTITEVADGDSLTLTTPEGTRLALRLYGVDAPEGGRAFSAAARAFVAEQCLDKAVAVQVERHRDAYGRTVGRVTYGEGDDLGLALVTAGLAWWQPKEAPDDAILRGAEADARTARRGLWQDDNPKPPWKK